MSERNIRKISNCCRQFVICTTLSCANIVYANVTGFCLVKSFHMSINKISDINVVSYTSPISCFIVSSFDLHNSQQNQIGMQKRLFIISYSLLDSLIIQQLKSNSPQRNQKNINQKELLPQPEHLQCDLPLADLFFSLKLNFKVYKKKKKRV